MSVPDTNPVLTETAGFIPINDQPGLQPVIREAAPGGFSEAPDSPEVDLAEHCSVKRVLQGDYTTLLELMRFPGTLVKDAQGNTFRTLTSNVKHKKGNRALLTIQDEWVSGDGLVPPPDDFDIDPVEFNPALEKNAFYIKGDPALTDDDIMRIKQAVDAPQVLGRTENGNNPYDPSDPTSDLWDSLLTSFQRGETTFYLSGFKLVWTRYYNSPQPIDAGGYTQAPASDKYGDIIPSFFVRPASGVLTLPAGGSTAWLRTADKPTYQRGWFRVTRSWIFGPDGQWDGDIYPDYFGEGFRVPTNATNTGNY